MARPGKGDVINGEYFVWRLFNRDGVFYADGRGNQPSIGKHSLNTRDRPEALERLRQLDRLKAVELGKCLPSTIPSDARVTISAGWQMYLNHARRPEINGGTSPKTQSRYTAVRDKHEAYCRAHSVEFWDQVDRDQFDGYSRYLNQRKFAPRTLYLELTTIKSVNKYLIRGKRLADSCRLDSSLKRPHGTDTYCYKLTEVQAMVAHCQAHPHLSWMDAVIQSLALTGMRIGELASLKWTDIKLDGAGVPGFISLTDDRASARRQSNFEQRRIKGRRGRIVPIHSALKRVLANLPRHPDGRLFHGPQGGKLKPDTVRNIFVRDVIGPLKSQFPTPKGEVGFADGRLHSFRHYFVSQAFLQGATESEVKQWVGHRDSRVVEIYRHLSDEESRQKLERLNLLGEHRAADGPLHQQEGPRGSATEAGGSAGSESGQHLNDDDEEPQGTAESQD